MIPTLSIVILESDSSARNAIGGVLKSFGGQVGVVATATNLQGGMKSLQTSTPHIVLLEVKDVEQGVKETSFIVSRWPQTMVFALTAEKNPDWILRLIRAGASEYLTKPIVASELSEAIRKILRQVGRTNGESDKEGATITVYNPSGGMGTTTIAVNLAATLAAQGEKVALMDLNLFCGNVTAFLDLTPRYSLASVTNNMGRVDANFIMSAMERHSSGLHVLSGPADLEESAEITPEQLQEVIAVMRTVFTYTIIDTGGPILGCNLATFASSDQILFTTVLDLPALINAKRHLPALYHQDIATGRVKLVVNRHIPKDSTKVTDAEKILGTKAYITVPNGYADVRASINKGEPLIACYPRSPVSKAINDLAQLLKQEIKG